MKGYDKILEIIKPFGLYQKRMLFLYGCPMAFYAPMLLYMLVFISFEPNHMCKVPSAVYQNNLENAQNATWLMTNLIPRKLKGSGSHATEEFSRCSVYDYSHINWTLDDSSFNGSGNVSSFACDEWTYDKSDKTENLVSKWNLVCGKSAIVSVIFTASTAAEAFGSLVFSHLMDHLGRKPVMVIVCVGYFIFGLIILLAPNWQVFIGMVMVHGLGLRCAFQLAWLFTQELVGAQYRSIVYMAMGISWSLGCATLALFSWMCTSWRQIVLFSTLPSIFGFVHLFLVEESPRWLVATVKVSKAETVLRRIAKLNGVHLHDTDLSSALELIKNSPSPKSSGYGFWTLFMNGQNLALKTIITCFLLIVVTVVYMGLNYNVNNLGGNPYVIFAVTSLMEIPAYILTPMSNKAGRVFLTSVSLLAAGIGSACTIVVPKGYTWLVILLATATKLSITYAFNMMLLIIAELYPTVLRGTGSGVCEFVAETTSAAVPFLVYTAKNMTFLPMIIFAVISILGSFVVVLLPETAGQPLMDTLEEEKRLVVGFKSARQNICFWERAEPA